MYFCKFTKFLITTKQNAQKYFSWMVVIMIIHPNMAGALCYDI